MFDKKTLLLVVLALLTIDTVKAQDPLFTQFNSVPLYNNPAFAGSITESRLALNYRNQWKGIYKTMYISYDQPVRVLHGGLGLIVYNDVEGSNMNIFYSALVYAPKFQVKEKFTISPGIKIGYRR